MGKTFRPDAAEREANEIAFRFQNSSDVMQDMSRAYHVDFSDIKIHTDAAADSKVRAAGKDALAKGKDLFFGKGIFESDGFAEKGLVAHELAHTMQQGSALGGEGTVSEMAPMGAEQGGLIDWFKKKFSRKPPRPNGIIAGTGKKMTDKDSLEYMRQMREKETEISRREALAKAMPQANTEGLSEDWKARMAGFKVDALQKADTELEDSIKRGEAEESQISSAYQALGHRNTRNEIGEFDKDLRAEQVFQGSTDSYQNYFMTRAKSGEDFSEVFQGAVPYKVGSAEQMINPAIAGATGDLLSVIGGYLSNEKGLDYVEGMLEQVQEAGIFQQKGIDPMNYIMTTLLTGEGLRGLGATRDGLQKSDLDGQRTGQTMAFSMKAIKNLMSLPIMERISEEERKALPPDILPLFDQYTRLQQQIREKLAQRRVG